MRKSIWAGFVVFCLASGGLVGSALAWELLGEKKVGFENDNDRIHVRKKEGRFKEIQVRVKDAPVEIHSMVVTFGNGKTFEPNLREKFRADSQSRAIALPGDGKRRIANISFKYESIETSDRRNKRGNRSEIDSAIRTLERAGYNVTPPRHSGGRGGHDGSKKAHVQVWAR